MCFFNDQQPILGSVSLYCIFKMSYKEFMKWGKTNTRLFRSVLPPTIWGFFHVFTKKIMFLKCFDLCQLIDKNMDLSKVLMCISFIMHESECLSICLKAICISFSVYYLFIFHPFICYHLVFCFLISWVSLAIRKIGLPLYWVANIFSFLFILMVNTFCLNNFFFHFI